MDSVSEILKHKEWFMDVFNPPDEMTLPDRVDGPWLEEKGLIEVYQAVQALAQKNHASLAQVKQVLQDWRAWRQRMEADLVYPPTAENTAWVLKRGLKECPLAIYSLALAYPRWTIMLLKKFHPETMKEFKNERGWVVQFYQPDPSKVESSVKSDSMGSESIEKSTKKTIEDDRAVKKEVSTPTAPPAEVSLFKEQLHGLIADSMKEDVAIVRERLDGFLKLQRSRTPEINFFFETIEALAQLKDEKLTRLAEVWPLHFQFRIEPEAWMSHPRYWVALKPLVHHEVFFLETIMPKLVDSKNWPPERRYELFTKINQHNKDRLNWFRQRFRLWQALGGDVDQPVLLKDNKADGESCFLAAEPTSVRQWVENQHQPDWLKVIPSRFARRLQP